MADINNIQHVIEAVTELRTEVELKTKNIGKIDRIEKFLEEQEVKNQSLVKEIEAKKAKQEELEEKLSNMEKELYRPRAGDPVQEKSQEVKSFEKLIIKGGDELAPEEKKYLRTNSGQEGGFLVPVDYAREIIKGITEVSPMRSLARTLMTSSSEVHIPKRTALVSGGWVAEGHTTTAANSTYGLEKLIANKMLTIVDITHEQLSDAAFSMEAEIFADVQEDFAKIEGLSFISGTGVGQSEGILTNTGVGSYVSGVADYISADSIIEIAGEVKTGYNLSYLMNRKTRAKVRTLKTGDGAYIWQPGLGDGNPNTINGLPYVETPDMPDIAADAYPIAIGDWRRSYVIVDNISVQMIRDGYSQAGNGKVRFIFYKRTGGKVVLVEGIKKLKCAAS